ncbi:tetratricopeptide repeat protein [Novosphingobium album (ex Liu et al. 2023)]|uniref:protein O-GlcNAc transferase n=1 Tax=Novosphingobium album (ex Liu et al. 2023) TaxID=3031130 RepID=A0ABT5WJX4_9SPHN|nr:tetratricopeptide repeat protein [Novosphingobium album (ex Liu et al. 2023)]MDE8650326.1 tetratricopeptide repeat protein [Novosphingobium album (ex Liu et al. 2023)]
MSQMSIDRALRRAVTAQRKGAVEEAKAIYAQILRVQPNNARARQALGALQGGAAASPAAVPIAELQALLTAFQNNAFAPVAVKCEALLSQFPQSHELWFLLGSSRKFLNDATGAIDALGKAVALHPTFAQAHVLLGESLVELGRREAAVTAFERAVELEPANIATLASLGRVFKALRRLNDALSCFRRIVEHDPAHADAHFQLGMILRRLGRYPEAVDHLARVLEADPDRGWALGDKLHCQAQMCDWRAFSEFATVKARLGVEPNDAVSPWTMLAFEDDPMRQKARSANHAARNMLPETPAARPGPWPRRGRIRVGYFASEFGDTALMHLMSGLFREHDRTRFEIVAFGYGPPRSGGARDELIRHVDRFIEIEGRSDKDVAALARQLQLDIAIDLNGYTSSSRSRLFALHLAPVQINFLGYPGTMGADFMDYIVADPVVIPPAERAAYSERVIYLPNSYLPTDNRLAIAETPSARADFGLPASGFVFCCFNQPFKITPREFAIWMRLLGKVEGSVLWLLRSNEWAEANLRREAAERGIDGARLIFADRMASDRHLDRHRHADLFIDTFHVNAHTTAADALWAGLPVVTLAGRQFAARVAASVLRAADMPELITHGEDEYEAVILALATSPARLAAVRKKLLAHRATSALFDTARYTRDFEQALTLVYERSVPAAA